MSKEKNIADELESVDQTVEQNEETKKVKKEQTPEELATIMAGIDKIKIFGVSDNFAVVMENLVPGWNDADKDALSAKKEIVIKHFGGSETLKNYVDGDFQKELAAIQGIAKTASILNNVKAFYARRNPGTAKAKMVQVNIGGVLYNVDSTFYAEISEKPREEKRELLLAHPATVVCPSVPEVL